MSKLEQVLQQYQKKNIAVYGLGSETERLLDKLGTQYHIAGLLDSFREEGEFYGKPVIALKETVEKEVGLILVPAESVKYLPQPSQRQYSMLPSASVVAALAGKLTRFV